MRTGDRTCDWCGEPIKSGEKVVFVVEAEDRGTKIDPSFPRAVYHPGNCANVALPK